MKKSSKQYNSKDGKQNKTNFYQNLGFIKTFYCTYKKTIKNHKKITEGLSL